MRLEYLLSGADLSELSGRFLSGFGNWIGKEVRRGSGWAVPSPEEGDADSTKSCSSVG